MNTFCSNSFKSLTDIINYGTCVLIKSVVPFLFALATVAFIWGVIQMFLNPDNEEARKQGKSYVLWGLIGLFVMVSVWGLVDVFSATFNINRNHIAPQINTIK